MTEREVDWAAVERAYRQSDLSLKKLGERFGTSPHAIGRRARRYGWPLNAARRKAAEKMNPAHMRTRSGARTGRTAEVVTAERLHRLVRRLTDELERRLNGEGDEASRLNEREGTAQILNALMRAVAGLTALGRASAQERNGNMRGAGDAGGGELGADAAWAEVERRLARLAAEGGAGAIPEQPDAGG